MDPTDTAGNHILVTDYLEHFGVKGMHWGEHLKSAKGVASGSKELSKNVADFRKSRVGASSQTKKASTEKIDKAGGIHNVSDKELKAMLARLNLEKQYSTMIHEDKLRREEGLKAAGKVLGEVGKTVVPALINAAAIIAAAKIHTDGGGFGGGTFKAGKVNVSPRMIEGISRALSSK
jgi:hypothetical protein